MSRSVKKIPISGCAASSTNKPYRSQENRAKRHWVKQLLIMQQYDSMPHDKEYGNEWSSPRDGKMYFGNMLYKPCVYCRWYWLWGDKCECDTRLKEYTEMMRK